MKKLLKNAVLFTIIAMVCVTLAGCGDNSSSSNEKADEKNSTLVASKYFDNDKYNEKFEVEFDNDGYATQFSIIMEFEDEESAIAMHSILSTSTSMGDADIGINDKKITIKMSAEDFYNEESLSYENNKATKDEIRKIFEDNGFTIEE